MAEELVMAQRCLLFSDYQRDFVSQTQKNIITVLVFIKFVCLIS